MQPRQTEILVEDSQNDGKNFAQNSGTWIALPNGVAENASTCEAYGEGSQRQKEMGGRHRDGNRYEGNWWMISDDMVISNKIEQYDPMMEEIRANENKDMKGKQNTKEGVKYQDVDQLFGSQGRSDYVKRDNGKRVAEKI